MQLLGEKCLGGWREDDERCRVSEVESGGGGESIRIEFSPFGDGKSVCELEAEYLFCPSTNFRPANFLAAAMCPGRWRRPCGGPWRPIGRRRKGHMHVYQRNMDFTGHKGIGRHTAQRCGQSNYCWSAPPSPARPSHPEELCTFCIGAASTVPQSTQSRNEDFPVRPCRHAVNGIIDEDFLLLLFSMYL